MKLWKIQRAKQMMMMMMMMGDDKDSTTHRKLSVTVLHTMFFFLAKILNKVKIMLCVLFLLFLFIDDSFYPFHFFSYSISEGNDVLLLIYYLLVILWTTVNYQSGGNRDYEIRFLQLESELYNLLVCYLEN